MVYQTYEVEAFVLSSKGVNESSKFFYLLTKEFGLVMAFAQSIRGGDSKLRLNLQTLSKTKVSLIRGREYFRVVWAKEAEHYFIVFNKNKPKLRLVEQMFRLILRLVKGEGQNDYLFETIDNFVSFLKKNDLPKEPLYNLEILVVTRILYSLGYIKDEPQYNILLGNSKFSDDHLKKTNLFKKELLLQIDRAFKESHL